MTQKANLSFKNTFPYISVIDEARDFKFGMQLVLAKAHHEIPQEEKVVWPWARGTPEICGFPFNIFATAEASDFKFGTQLGFDKAHHKITSRRKRKGGLGLGELLKILGFPYNISATAGASDYKFGTQLGFAEAHHKITRRRKGEHGPRLGELPKFGVFSQYLHYG